MQKSYRFLVSILFLGVLLLGACSGALPQQDDSSQGPADSSQSAEAVFTGTVESMVGSQWLISGQLVDVDGATLIDPNIQVGDVVKVEANVSADGTVIALQIESSGPDDVVTNDNATNGNDANTNDDNANGNENTNSSNDNGTDDNSNTAPAGSEQEAFGVVEVITDDTIAIGGIAYGIANFTEFKDLIAVGDQVKIEFVVNEDGTFTIREIEKSTGIGNDNGNSNNNSNFNGNDNDDDNSNGNSNDDDHDNDNSNSNSNDDDDDDNSNDSNSNDD